MSLLIKKFERKKIIRKNKIRYLRNTNFDEEFNNIEEIIPKITDLLKYFEKTNIENYNEILIKIQHLLLKLNEVLENNDYDVKNTKKVFEILKSKSNNYFNLLENIFKNFENKNFEITKNILKIFCYLDIDTDYNLISQYFMYLINIYNKVNNFKIIEFMFEYFSINIELLKIEQFNDINRFLISFFNENKYIDDDVILFFEYYYKIFSNLNNELYNIYFYFFDCYTKNNNIEYKMKIFEILINGLNLIKINLNYANKITDINTFLQQIFYDLLNENNKINLNKYIDFFIILSEKNEEYGLDIFFEKINFISKTIDLYKNTNLEIILIIYSNLNISDEEYYIISNNILYNDKKKFELFNNWELINFIKLLKNLSKRYSYELEDYYEDRFKDFMLSEIKNIVFKIDNKLLTKEEIELCFKIISKSISFFLNIKKIELQNNKDSIFEEFEIIYSDSLSLLENNIDIYNSESLFKIKNKLEEKLDQNF